MPQNICSLCVDKIIDFYEFRDMCIATNIQTRKLLGISEAPTTSIAVNPLIRKRTDPLYDVDKVTTQLIV